MTTIHDLFLEDWVALKRAVGKIERNMLITYFHGGLRVAWLTTRGFYRSDSQTEDRGFPLFFFVLSLGCCL
jgi:hypothetical protein